MDDDDSDADRKGRERWVFYLESRGASERSSGSFFFFFSLSTFGPPLSLSTLYKVCSISGSYGTNTIFSVMA